MLFDFRHFVHLPGRLSGGLFHFASRKEAALGLGAELGRPFQPPATWIQAANGQPSYGSSVDRSLLPAPRGAQSSEIIQQEQPGPATPGNFHALHHCPQLRGYHHNESVYMFHNKSNFAAALSDQFRTSANWRKGQARRFSHDGRNIKAAQGLLSLESQISISNEAWTQLEPLVSNPTSLAATSETNRDIGFRTHPADFGEWLENLHTNLTRH